MKKKYERVAMCMAIVLLISLVNPTRLSSITVSDNIGESLNWLKEVIGVDTISTVPDSKSAFNTASLMEKINYLEKENAEMKSALNSLSTQIANLAKTSNTFSQGIGAVS